MNPVLSLNPVIAIPNHAIPQKCMPPTLSVPLNQYCESTQLETCNKELRCL